MLTEPVIRQAASLIAQHAVDDSGQRFAAQHLTCLSDELVVERVRREAITEQPLKMGVETVLCDGIAGVTQRPIGGYPVLQKAVVATLFQAKHKVGAQATKQALSISQVGTYLGFELMCNARQ